MKVASELDDVLVETVDTPAELLRRDFSAASEGATVGELLGLKDEGCTALVVFPGQIGSAAVAARTTVDLFGRHIGKPVVLTFEGGNRTTPIVVGVIRSGAVPSRELRIAEVEADGERLIVHAKEQLSLRCGDASITLTKEGKVVIQGTFVSTRSSGLNRIVGGSVQIN